MIFKINSIKQFPSSSSLLSPNSFDINNIASNFYFAEYASKTAFKSISGEPKPFILHIATHGYFLSDSVTNDQNDTNNDYIFNMDIVKYSEDPLVRSGLVFAGANKALFNTSSNIISDDGILSAVEISNLNLSNSKLVVLSSCDDGDKSTCPSVSDLITFCSLLQKLVRKATKEKGMDTSCLKIISIYVKE